MDDMALNAARPPPAGQPKAVPPSLVGHRDARNRAASSPRLVPPALQQPQQLVLIGAIFFSGWRSIPGTIAPTSQLARLISITAINVLSRSTAASDLLTSFGCGTGHSVNGVLQRRLCLRFAARPIASCSGVHLSRLSPSS
jgi:hypothetical protein